MSKAQRITRCWVTGCNVPVSEQGPCVLHRKEEEWTTLRAQNARLREAAEECLSVMEIQEKRSEGLFHLAAHAFVPLWTRAKESARRALEEG